MPQTIVIIVTSYDLILWLYMTHMTDYFQWLLSSHTYLRPHWSYILHQTTDYLTMSSMITYLLLEFDGFTSFFTSFMTCFSIDFPHFLICPGHRREPGDPLLRHDHPTRGGAAAWEDHQGSAHRRFAMYKDVCDSLYIYICIYIYIYKDI